MNYTPEDAIRLARMLVSTYPLAGFSFLIVAQNEKAGETLYRNVLADLIKEANLHISQLDAWHVCLYGGRLDDGDDIYGSRKLAFVIGNQHDLGVLKRDYPNRLQTIYRDLGWVAQRLGPFVHDLLIVAPDQPEEAKYA